MTFKTWSDVTQNDEWAKFAVAWKHALLNWRLAHIHGFVVEVEVEALIIEVINNCIAHNQHKIAFDQLNPRAITFDGVTWAKIKTFNTNEN